MHNNASEDANAPQTFTYCPGPRSVFKLIENGENMKAVPQDVSNCQEASQNDEEALIARYFGCYRLLTEN